MSINEHLDRIEKELHSVKKLLIGNGEVGVAEMARRAFEYMLRCKATRNGLLDWTFRAVITIMVAFIALKVGLK